MDEMAPNQQVIDKTKKNALLLAAFATACTLIVALTYLLTAPVIEQQKQQNVLNTITQVLDETKFDNNPLFNCTLVSDPALTGQETTIPVYRATLNGDPYAIAFQTQTQKGYNGRIEMMVAIDKQGRIQGVRTLSHQETPGLGDKIELQKSDWILDFNGKSVASEDDARWTVKKDGGQFDQFTGATITPRAYVNQLRTSVHYAKTNFETLFSASNDCLAPMADTASDIEELTEGDEESNE